LLQISPPNASSITHSQTRHIQQRPLPANIEDELAAVRLPRAVQAAYLSPLKRLPTHNIPTCDLQLRSYSVRNLEVFTDFAMRAAYYLNLAASGPVPLPKITERWTVPKSNFVHKKSQENFERVTLRRLIQIKDGHPDVLKVWLAFLKKYHYHGVGMKANLYDYSGLEVAKDLDAEAERISAKLGESLELTGFREYEAEGWKRLEKQLVQEPFKAQWGADAPMSANQEVPPVNKKIVDFEVRSTSR
jgi:small subunit ribosomal protein S10